MVREIRLAFQADMADQFKSVADTALGQKLPTCHSQIVFDPPMEFEIFALEPSE